MSRISGIIAIQTKKLNLERDLRKETEWHKMSYKRKSENSSHPFWVYIIIHPIWKFQSYGLKPVPTGGRRILIFASKIDWEKINSKDLARAPRLAG